MPECGSQIILCGLPIRFDTYKGCSHFCKYCFVQRKGELARIEGKETEKALAAFIQGARSEETNWCDWDIPLHWGGLSDPFQPIERERKLSLACLRVFDKTQYPFVVSTKGRLAAEEPYLSLLETCNCVVQISMVCSEYDKLEKGAPPYEERLRMVEALAKRGKRVNIRIQPYMTEVLQDVLQNIPRLKSAGAHGVIVEGMKFAKKQPGLVKAGGDFVYPKETLARHYSAIRDTAHKHGLKFYCGENRLRDMGDSLICCGIDGLEGYKGNEFNLCHLLNGSRAKPTERMKEKGTARCMSAIDQSASGRKNLRELSMADALLGYYAKRKEYIKTIFGK